MKTIYSLAIFLITLPSFCQSLDEQIESALINCLKDSYSQKGVDIISELDKLEKFLIKNELINGSSGQDYYNFYINVVDKNDIDFTIDKERFEKIYRIQSTNRYPVNCLDTLELIDTSNSDTSKFDLLQKKLHSISTESLNPSLVASSITEIIEPSDFERPYYRAMALLTIAFTSNIETGLSYKLHASQPKYSEDLDSIFLHLTSHDKFELNSQLVSGSELNMEIKRSIKKHEKNQLIVLTANSNTSYSFYSEAQNRLLNIYQALRNELSLSKYGDSFNSLKDERKNKILKIYPTHIKE
jgi:hypothetical protein